VIFFGIALLAIGQPQPASVEPLCAEVCQFKSDKSDLINMKQKGFDRITEAYRPYFSCYRESVAMLSMFWETGKEVENVKFADEFSWMTCEKERLLAENQAAEIGSAIFPKLSAAEITSGLHRYRAALAFTIQVVHYQKIAKLEYLMQYARRFPSAPNP
jgi:hypothetical protein